MSFQSIDKVTEATEQCLIAGRFSFELLRDQFETIVKIGNEVKNFSNSKISRNNDILFTKKIKTLASNIEQLSNGTRSLIANLKNNNEQLDVQSKKVARFEMNVFQYAQQSCQLMLITMSYPCRWNVRQFECEFPCMIDNIITSFMDYLEDEIPNKRENLEKNWKEALEAVLTQLIFIKAYYSGIRLKENFDEIKELADRIEEILENMQTGNGLSWRRTVKNLVCRIQDENEIMSNSEKADLLKGTLEVFFGEFSFIVIVFDECEVGCSFTYEAIENQSICSLQRGSCNVIVYRSCDWKSLNQFNRSNFIEQVAAQKQSIPNSGFVGIIRKEKNVEVRGVNCEGNGPGNWINTKNKANEEFTMIVGYK